MRILAAIVVPPHLSASGAARAGLRLSDSLAEYCDITVAAMSNVDLGSGEQARRVTVRSWIPALFRLLPRRYRSLFYKSDIPQIVRRGYDLVHLHNPMPALEMARVARACIRSGVPYVVSTHGFNEIANGNAVYGLGALRRKAWQVCVQRPVSRVVKHAAGIFALSSADVGIVKAFGFAGKPSIVPNGVEPPSTSNVDADRTIYRRFGLPRRDEFPGITCMFLGNHTPNKGVPILLAAFSQLECSYLLIVGGERRPEIDYDKFTRTGREDQRVVVTGRLSDAEIGALLRRSDLFVFPTLADTFPLVVLEAMVQGVPVLASDVGGISHQLDPSCGELIAPGDPAALCAAIGKLARDRPRLRAMGASARVRATTKFTWGAAAAEALRGYERVCPRFSPATPIVPQRSTSAHFQESQT